VKILAFSDLHGNIEVLKLLKKRIEGESFDYMLIAGDLTNAYSLENEEILQHMEEIFSVLESFEIPYYFVWGLPFRELKLELLFMEGLRRKDSKEGVIGKEIVRLISSLKFGRLLRMDKPIKLGEYWLTSSPKIVSENTILMIHTYRKLVPEALLHLEGHVHYGQRVFNYLNLGFLYKDDLHGSKPLIGCYWIIDLKGSHFDATLVDLGGNLKRLQCPRHPDEGTFYIPYFWRKCPVCDDPDNALIKGL